MAKGPEKFTIPIMKGVVEHYRAFRLQPLNCLDCRYVEFADSEECPSGYEEMRSVDRYISQCTEHNKPLYQWLHKADIETAARWLVKRCKRAKHYLRFPDIETEMRKDLGL
jgi:hypothetical protein